MAARPRQPARCRARDAEHGIDGEPGLRGDRRVGILGSRGFPLRSSDVFFMMGDRIRRWRTHTAWWLVLGAAGIQLRLLCNLLDGLLADRRRPEDEDGRPVQRAPRPLRRRADPRWRRLLLARFGWGLALGWSAAVLAVITAYVRVLGGSLGLRAGLQRPDGEAAPDVRADAWGAGRRVRVSRSADDHGAVRSRCVIIVAGAAFTLARRIARIARLLEAR